MIWILSQNIYVNNFNELNFVFLGDGYSAIC